MPKLKSSIELEKLREKAIVEENSKVTSIIVCGSTGCQAFGSSEVLKAFEKEVERAKLTGKVHLKRSGCHGFCERGPVVEVFPQGLFYQQVSSHDVSEIIKKTVRKGEVLEYLLYQDPRSGKRIAYSSEIPFYHKQKRIVLAENGKIDPNQITDYIAYGGYKALSKVLSEMSPQAIIEEVKTSGLRGRGGAGFPTGLKWQLASQVAQEIKYIICNGDEGDPGAFMDRSVLEGNPHKVLEGMLIAAYAVGATKGYVYVRAEYPLAVKNLRIALAQAEELGLLGQRILGTNFNFSIDIFEGAGAFVCGEETALMASIEGQRGMPRLRPPYPVQSGLWGKPTIINNVETFANVPSIVLKGGQSFASLGTEKSKGTKIFSLAGRVNNTGLVEVPMGASLREVIFDIGGGIPKGRVFKAVQTGGPLGGCISEKHLDLPIDYDSLQEVGAVMGSGGMIVADENSCMVDLARYFLDFAQAESCGKCVPCRIGTKRMLEILTRITQGQGRREDLDLLRGLSEVVKSASLCGLGQGAPNPVLSTLNHFEEEYKAHIEDKECPACTCDALVKAPCQHRCPAKVDAVSYISLVALGRFDEALAVHRERNPFPAICGRVCHHPCEVRCRRGEIDEPISIAGIKRFMADWEKDFPPPPLARETKEKKIAVIGAGPAGLSCAYQLALSGHKVTVFEALPVAGGMLTVGIPAYRLPREIIQKEIDYVTHLGVEIKTNTRLGKDFHLKDLLGQGYAAVFLAIGAHKGIKLKIPGEEALGVLDGITFLRQINLGEKISLGEKVAVIGGGDVAMDAARSALRLGVKEVSVIYRRSQEEMPAHSWDVEEAKEEGVNFLFLATPSEIIIRQGKVAAVRCVRMELGERDASGRRRPVPIKSSEFDLPVDTVIAAIGQFSDLSWAEKEGLEITEKNTLALKNSWMTSVSGVFAGGDLVSGPATVIEAIAHGQKAAFAIEKYLYGHSEREEELTKTALLRVESWPEVGAEGKREEMTALPSKERVKSFSEVVKGFSQEEAMREAKRCLRCDLE